MLRFPSIPIKRRTQTAGDRQRRRRRSERPAGRDRRTARASQGSGSRANPTARGDEAVRIRNGDPRNLS